MSHSLLIISHDVVGESMAGPGIRYYHLANVMAKHLPTTLAVPLNSTLDGAKTSFAVENYERGVWDSVAKLIAAHTICFFPGDIATDFPQLAAQNCYYVIDGYDPIMVETLSLIADLPLPQQIVTWQQRLKQLRYQFEIGDLFVCASERQRDWWLGLLEAHGRTNPQTFSDSISLRKLIDVLPYGIDNAPLPATKQLIKNVWAGIQSSDHLVLWGGGLWTWLDPLTAIRAIALVVESRPDVKLIFPGTKHPNPALKELTTQAVRAKQLALELELLDKNVFFGDWIPYADWPFLLQECSIALSLHYDTAETRLAFRSRVLEYIRADLPIITTCGDATSDLVAKHQLGAVVGYEDVAGVAQAIHHLLQVNTLNQAGFQQARNELAWQRCAEPLIRYCANPWHAADRGTILSISQKAEEQENTIKQQQERIDELERQKYADQARTSQLEEQLTAWKSLAQGYARGKIMRLLKWVQTRLPQI